MEQKRTKFLLNKMLHCPFLDILGSVSEMGVYTEILELPSLILATFLTSTELCVLYTSNPLPPKVILLSHLPFQH